MVNKNPKVPHNPIMPAAAITLTQYCPDLEQWPARWQVDDHDIAVGQSIVACFKPFLLHLLGEQLATKTLHRHRDHLWMLGSELIRKRHEDATFNKMPIEQAIAEMIEEEGGPLIWPSITEPQQNAFDATCRKLYKFLNSNANPVR
jgi:hypothetical protein